MGKLLKIFKLFTLFFLPIFFLLFSFKSNGQVNNWINFNQEYYVFKIYESGIYRITQKNLLDAGINLSQISPKNIQIFARNKEIPIFIPTESDNIFGENDFIEFYAQKNDSWFDAQLYYSNSIQNTNISLYNDTIYYFLTWNNKDNNKRLTNIFNAMNSFDGLTAETTIYKNIRKDFYSKYFYGLAKGVTFDLDFVDGEGWTGETIKRNEVTFNLKFPNLVPNTEIITDYCISGVYNIVTKINYIVSNSTTELTIPSNSFLNYNSKINSSSVINDTINIYFDNRAFTSNSQENSLTYINAKYQSKLLYKINGQEEFEYISTFPQLKVYKFLNEDNSKIIVHNLKDSTRITPFWNENYSRFILKTERFVKKAVITYENDIKNIQTLNKISFIDYEKNVKDYNYLIITNSKLISSANNYANYLNSIGFNSYVVDVENLYYQFSAGIRKHPLSIKNFLFYIYSKWKVSPKYVLLLGKSIENSNSRNSNFEKNLVPTIGEPPSDNFFAIKNVYTSTDTLITSIGRISAETNEEVENYLSKLKQNNSESSQSWKKNIIHFGGGNNEFEQTIFKNYLSTFQRILEEGFYGGNVFTQLKTSLNSLDNNLLEFLKSKINDGVGVLNFFGHGSMSGFEVSLDQPENYENKGKYPFMISNSCFTGNFHSVNKIEGENFVLAKDKGMIGFLASSNLSSSESLFNYNNQFFFHLSNDLFGKSVGEIILATQKDIFKYYSYLISTTSSNNLLSLLINLEGDPSLVIFNIDKPDYFTNKSEVKIKNGKVSINKKSFTLEVPIINSGKNVKEDLKILVERLILNTNKLEIIENTFQINGFSKTLSIDFDVNGFSSFGLNKFNIIIDPQNKILESNELNNLDSIELFIGKDPLIPIFPPKNAIIPDEKITLKVQTNNTLPNNQEDVIQIEVDTSWLFNSKFLKKNESNIKKIGVIYEWPLDLILKPNIQYYWRTKYKYENDSLWQYSAFKHIKQTSGWEQSNFGQFIRNGFLNMIYNDKNKIISFDTLAKEISIKSDFDKIDLSNNVSQFYIDGYLQANGTGYTLSRFKDQIIVAVIDNVTLEPLSNFNNYFGQNPINLYGEQYKRVFCFSYDDDLFESKILDIYSYMKHGQFMIIYTYNSGNYNTWNDGFFTYLNGWGIKAINKNTDINLPYICLLKKGFPNQTKELLGKIPFQKIELKDTLKTTGDHGTILTEYIGPAKNWENFTVKFNPLSNNTTLNVKGINDDYSETLITNLSGITQDFENKNIQELNGYKFIKLEILIQDPVNRVVNLPYQFKIIFTQLPHLVINTYNGIEFKDYFSSNDSLIFKSYLSNINGSVLEDEVTVKYSIINNFNTFNHGEKKIEFINSFENILLEKSTYLDRNSYYGNSIFRLTIPNSPKFYIEQNNYDFLFNIQDPSYGPYFNITFDGASITENEFVTTNPNINISVYDPFSRVDIEDTSNFNFYLTAPNKSQINLISESKFSKFDIDKNQKRVNIDFKPELNTDGVYNYEFNLKSKLNTIFIEKRNLNVSLKNSINDIYNYPNPFFTRTRFKFEIKGNARPIGYVINIFSINGELIGEYNLNEVNNVKVGNNEIWLDLELNNGNTYLTPGVYIYKIKIMFEKTFGENNFYEKSGKMIVAY